MKKLTLILFLLISIVGFSQTKPTYTGALRPMMPGNYIYLGNYDTTAGVYKDTMIFIMSGDNPKIWGKNLIQFYCPIEYNREVRISDYGITRYGEKIMDVTDTFNVFSGYLSGNDNSGLYNTGYGSSSLNNNSGNSNIAIGFNAGSANDGNNCVFLGQNSGAVNNAGNYVIGLGAYSAPSNIADSVLFIGYGASPLIFGDFKAATKEVTINASLNVTAIPAYADSTSARTAGVINGGIYRIGGTLKIMY